MEEEKKLLGSNIFGTWRSGDNHECQNEGDRKYHTIDFFLKKKKKKERGKAQKVRSEQNET